MFTLVFCYFSPVRYPRIYQFNNFEMSIISLQCRIIVALE